MLFDVVLSKVGDEWELYYAPYWEGPKEGEFFNAADEGSIAIRKAHRVYNGVADDSELWKMLQDLAGKAFKKIHATIRFWPLDYREEKEGF